MMSVLNHFMMVNVSAMGQQSLRQGTKSFLETGIMVVTLTHAETTVVLRGILKMSVKISARWSSQPVVDGGSDGLPHCDVILCLKACIELIEEIIRKGGLNVLGIGSGH